MRRRGLDRKRETNVTEPAAAVYRAAFNGEPLPRGWRVIRTEKLERADLAGYPWSRPRVGWYLGVCSRATKTIYLTARAWEFPHGAYEPKGSGWLGVLIHEFIHARCPGLKHGPEFRSLVAAAYARVWEGC